MDKVKTGELIRRARTQKGYTQVELGDLIGVSNKAVSRWEKGESFPDIGVLESLSNILGVKIEELVIGESVPEAGMDPLNELVRVAVLQKRQSSRDMSAIAVGAVCAMAWLWCLVNTMLGYGAWPWGKGLYLAVFACIHALLVVRIASALEDEFLGIFGKGRLVTAVFMVSAGSVIYMMVLLYTVSMWAKQGIEPFQMPLYSLGPFVNVQLIAVFLGNMCIADYSSYKNLRYEEGFTAGIFVQLGAMHLAVVYSDFLHRMAEPAETARVLAADTAVVWALAGAAAVAAAGLRKYKKRAGDGIYSKLC